jgi:GNAT superfamily N-acetyltransferase
MENVMSVNDQLSFRYATENEMDAVLDLIDSFDRPTAPRPNPSQLKKTLASIEQAGGGVVIATLGERVVGTCTLNLCANLSWTARPYAMIENVIVDRQFRQQGIGKAMLEFTVQQAKTIGCYKVALMTGSKRESTLAFYEASGFEPKKVGFQIRFNAS